MRLSDILVVGFVAAIGFTVSLFIATVAFDAGPVQDSAKMGALLSLGAAVVAIVVGKALRTSKGFIINAIRSASELHGAAKRQLDCII